ncbi:MAG: elongation factor G, partial [Hyphomicrobiales bacterium]|nr:elongation factor G [Hyphomicrobiales bacterium]
MGEAKTTSSEPKNAGPRLIAIVGPFQSGKTTLLEAMLARAGAITRQGTVREGTSVGDLSPEARSHGMSVESNIATAEFLGDRYTFVDCPGSIEFMHEMSNVLPVCDAAIVVCEADAKKTPALQMIMREIEQIGLPRILFLNKIDAAAARLRDTLALLQPASRTPLLLRQIPIWKDGIATGFIDLALERAFVYREHAMSTVIDLPADELDRKKEARFSMLERLADYDDGLMEELISDIEPSRDKVFADMVRELRTGHLVPLMIGSADRGNGVTRLLKALRHEVPGVEKLRERQGLSAEGPALAHVMRSIHTAHGGKLSFARVLRGSFADGTTVTGSSGAEERIAGLSRLVGSSAMKIGRAETGDAVAFLRLDHIATGDCFTDAKEAPPRLKCSPPAQPVQIFALSVKDRKDEVRMAAALGKLVEEDPSLIF